MVFAEVASANGHLGDNITAALKLGDMSYLDLEFEWLDGLLANRDWVSGLLPSFLQAYYGSVSDNLDERGEPLLHWLKTRIEQN